MNLIINLISGTFYLCESKEYIFIIFWKYTIISRSYGEKNFLNADPLKRTRKKENKNKRNIMAIKSTKL